MSKLQRLCTAAALALCALAPPAATAGVVFLSAETESHSNERHIFKGIKNDFMLAAGGSFSKDLTGALSTGAYSDADVQPGDTVVVVARTVAITQYSVLENWMKTRPDLKIIIITESGQAQNAQNIFQPTIANDILHWPEAQITHLSSSNYTAVPLKSGTYFESNFKGINSGINNGVSYGNEDDLRVHTYGVMECIPDKDTVFSYSQSRCDRNIGETPANDDTYYHAGDCKIRTLLEDVKKDSKICHYNTTTYASECKTYNTESEAETDVQKATAANNTYKEDYVKPRNSDNAAMSFVIPKWQSNYGQGACILFLDDGNPMDNEGDTSDTDNHAHDIFTHVNQRKYIAQKYLDAAGSACAQDMKTGAKECTMLSAGDRCELMEAPASAKSVDIDVTKGGKCTKSAMWCDSKEEHRKDRCDTAAGEDPTTHCCTTKALPASSPASVPTTGWPALLGLSALLPLLATRRRRK